MTNKIQSLLIGAAVAALVTLPAKAADTSWVNGPTKSYDVKALKLDGVVGTLKIEVKDGPATLAISGLKQRVAGMKVHVENGRLVVEGHYVDSVWDWSNWFDFSHLGENKPDQLIVHVSVPKGTSVKVDELVGNAAIGDTQGEMEFGATGNTQSTIGNVAKAHIELAGSGKVTLANVAGALSAETAGSGDIHAGDATSVDGDIAGSGSIGVGHVAGAIKIDIAGSGDFTAASVNGPVDADIAGSGSVSIGNGEANPLHVDIMGSGNLSFGGTAVDPEVSAMGSGSVKIKAYRGKLSNSGMSNLKIGD